MNLQHAAAIAKSQACINDYNILLRNNAKGLDLHQQTSGGTLLQVIAGFIERKKDSYEVSSPNFYEFKAKSEEINVLNLSSSRA